VVIFEYSMSQKSYHDAPDYDKVFV